MDACKTLDTCILYILPQIVALTKDVTDVDVVIFPPHPFLIPVQRQLTGSNIKVFVLPLEYVHVMQSNTATFLYLSLVDKMLILKILVHILVL